SYFAAKYTQTLVCFFHGNRHFGRLFLALLLAHCPSNVCFLMWVIHDQVKGMRKIFVASFFFYGLLIIFGLHLILSVCSNVIHKPSKRLLHLMAKNIKKQSHKMLRC